MPDDLGRTPIADAVKQSIAEAFTVVPDGKRGALVVLADEQGARAMLAARLNGNWKIAGGASVPWKGPRPSGYVAIEGSW